MQVQIVWITETAPTVLLFALMLTLTLLGVGCDSDTGSSSSSGSRSDISDISSDGCDTDPTQTPTPTPDLAINVTVNDTCSFLLMFHHLKHLMLSSLETIVLHDVGPGRGDAAGYTHRLIQSNPRNDARCHMPSTDETTYCSMS